MKYRETGRTDFDTRAKIIIFASILISFFVILIPVWQKGLTRSTHYEILLSEKKLESLEEEERNLIASILEADNEVKTFSEVIVAGI